MSYNGLLDKGKKVRKGKNIPESDDEDEDDS